MSANEKFGFQSTKAYRKTSEYVAASRHHRRGILKLIFSLIAVAVPALYFAVAVQLEHHLLPLWSMTIGFYIFMFGLVGAAIIIPLFFRLLQCPFTYWKLFIGIAASLGFGYLIQKERHGSALHAGKAGRCRRLDPPGRIREADPHGSRKRLA